MQAKLQLEVPSLASATLCIRTKGNEKRSVEHQRIMHHDQELKQKRIKWKSKQIVFSAIQYGISHKLVFNPIPQVSVNHFKIIDGFIALYVLPDIFLCLLHGSATACSSSSMIIVEDIFWYTGGAVFGKLILC